MLLRFFKTDYRGITSILAGTPSLRRVLDLARPPHWTALHKAHRRLLTFAAARRLLVASVEPALQSRRPRHAAADSTGFESSKISPYFVRCREGCTKEPSTAWYSRFPKLHTFTDVDTHLVLAAHPKRGPTPDVGERGRLPHDLPDDLKPRLLLADAGYDSEPVPFFDLPIERITPRYEVLRYGGGGEPTTLLCGAVRFSHPAAADLVSLLPEIIHIKGWSSPHADWMQSSLRLMSAEVMSQQAGGETIVTRLADILVVQAIRGWLAESAATQAGGLGALQDDRIGPAILLMHREPTKPWTVDSLAEAVHMSRSAFSARFSQLVGSSPVQYLTRWRMNVAGLWLREEAATLEECAARLGYESAAAFKRVVGVSPGAWRKAAEDELVAAVG